FVEGVTIITEVKDSAAVTDLSCLTSLNTCIDPDTGVFFAQQFTSQGLLPGASYFVEIYGSTGPAKSTPKTLQHIERPNPVISLESFNVFENMLQISWLPPQVGSLRGFYITMQFPDGTNVSQPSGSAMRYIARDLIPGEIYLFYVFTVADEEALVRSEPATLVQGTYPKTPLSIVATENVDSDGRTFTITVTPPDGGKWSGFEIIEIDDISATSSNVSNNVDSTEDFKVVQRETPSSFPIPFPSDSDVVNVSLARFGAVYRVNVKSVSDFNLRSVGVADTFVMTHMRPFDEKPKIILNNNDSVCLLWETDKTSKHFDVLIIAMYQNGRNLIDRSEQIIDSK
ncbi:uncharacterized protein LOC142356202, partial [Convolutriloba macropyga]|uniref:uncharacterized protein LOC142356202 n=1 Tax=Convolutriloba macropyga TaxID=536237 RepID=UPI003F51F0F7